MKQTIERFAARSAMRTCGFWLLTMAAPLSVAQAPAPVTSPPAPGTPPAAAPSPAETPPADTTPEHTSYLFGLGLGEQMHSVGITNQVNPEAINQGVKDGLAGKNKLTRADQQQIQQFVQSIVVATAAHNKAAAQEFLARNGRDKGVKTTASGLQYKIIKPGDAKGATVAPTDEVTVNYRGRLLDGTEFDSSYTRGTPATFKVNGVIKGWQEAMVLMKPGAKWQLFVPPELAYDASPRPGIPAGSLLMFDVELLSVKPADAQAPGAPMMPMPQSHKIVPPPTPAPSP